MSEADWNERLKAALARKGWTQAELARRVVDKDGKQLVPIASIRKWQRLPAARKDARPLG